MEASGRQSDQIFDIILQFLEFLNDDHKEKVLFFSERQESIRWQRDRSN